MAEKKILATFPLKGTSTAKTFPSFQPMGYTGESCLEATRNFENALGTVESSEATEEMYDTEERNEYLDEGDN